MEEYLKEVREEERNKTTIKMAALLLESGDMTEERIKELYELSDKQMKEIRKRVAVLV